MLKLPDHNGVTIQRSVVIVKTPLRFSRQTRVRVRPCGLSLAGSSPNRWSGNGGESTTVAHLRLNPGMGEHSCGSEPSITPDRVGQSLSKIIRRCQKAGGGLTHLITGTGTQGVAGQILERGLPLRAAD